MHCSIYVNFTNCLRHYYFSTRHVFKFWTYTLYRVGSSLSWLEHGLVKSINNDFLIMWMSLNRTIWLKNGITRNEHRFSERTIFFRTNDLDRYAKTKKYNKRNSEKMNELNGKWTISLRKNEFIFLNDWKKTHEMSHSRMMNE